MVPSRLRRSAEAFSLMLAGCFRPRWFTPPRRYFSTSRELQSRKPYYVTTPIFYPNASPHIGHLYSLVTGDVFTRFHRSLVKDDVKYLAGTDEHGLKIQKAARIWAEGKEGKEREFCDVITERFRELSARADISNTCFMRTTSAEHRRAVEDVWGKLYNKGFIYKDYHQGWYSITDECFYTESQVQVRENQTVSIETGAVVEQTAEENYMFRLFAFRELLLEHYTSNPSIVFPPQYHSDVLAMLQSLGDISISRPKSRLSWGVPVPNDSEHTVYVWFDALLIYLSGTGYPSQTVGWPPNLQIIGKDILRFHAIYLPAILMALSEKITYPLTPHCQPGFPLPQRLLTHAHWTVSQKKMSKSLGNVADPMEAMEKWGVDVVRFYLMRIGGRWRDDVDWSEEQLMKHAEEIQAQLGNYFLRAVSPKIASRAASAPSSLEALERVLSSESTDGLSTLNTELLKSTHALPLCVKEKMEALEAGEALGEIMAVLKMANKAFTTLAPWSPSCTPESARDTRLVALETLRVVGICLQPFMPGVSARMLDALDISQEERSLDDALVLGGRGQGAGFEKSRESNTAVKLFDFDRSKWMSS